jgi:sugar phosphate isomerase/epimerase
MTDTTRPHNIKRAVTFYSWRFNYFKGEMTLEDCIATAARLDIPGIEVIGEQMVPGFPEPGSEWLAQWEGWLDKYGRTPVAHDMFLDVNRYKGRELNEDEMVESVLRDIKFANRLGCTVIRMIHITPPAVMKQSARFAEEYNVKLALEVHAPHHLDNPWMQSQVAVMREVGSPYLGFTIDMGIFTKTLPRVVRERWFVNGMRREIADYIVREYNRHEGMGHVPEEVRRMGGTTGEIAMANRAARLIYMEPQRLLEYMPHILHIHGKFNEMVGEYLEESIPYEDVIPVLIEGGYNGYISSEFEGDVWVQDASELDSIEQVRRHQVMLKRLLGEEGEQEAASATPEKSEVLL